MQFHVLQKSRRYAEQVDAGTMSELDYQIRVTSLVSFTRDADTIGLRRVACKGSPE